MHAFYRDYRWNKGVPEGVEKCDQGMYRIVTDPYHKWYTVEKYRGSHLIEVVYDSHLLDFRQLKPFDQLGWRKEMMVETPNFVKDWIFNEDDRAIFIEESFFEKKHCRQCRILYPCGRLLSVHQLYYTDLHDPFNGVVLYDANNHPVMLRIYEGYQNGEWINLKKETWEYPTPPNKIESKSLASGRV